VDEASVPQKPYFRIGEVSRLTGVKPYVLRYWEGEFPSIVPTKTRSNQRLYRREDVERILIIKRLLYTERYTIAGARARLEGGASRSGPARDGATAEALSDDAAADRPALAGAERDALRTRLLELRGELAALRALLAD
jgi:DNA-binding transcriptional MerR regulator